MECKVKQFVLEEERNKVSGGWHTDISLTALGWTVCLDPQYIVRVCIRQMKTHAKDWARARGLVRTSEVHGQEEFRIPTSSDFSFETVRGRSTEGEAAFTLDDPQGTIFDGSDMNEETAISCLGCICMSVKMTGARLGVGLPLVQRSLQPPQLRTPRSMHCR